VPKKRTLILALLQKLSLTPFPLAAGIQSSSIDTGNSAFHLSMFRPVLRSNAYGA